MLSVVVNVDGAVTRFDTTALSVSDLDAPMEEFATDVLLARAREKYKAQDFAPLAESTVKKRVAKGLRRLETKLGQDLKKATTRAHKVPRGLLTALIGAADATLSGAVVTESRGERNTRAKLAEFQRRHRRDIKDRLETAPLSFKQLLSLGQREDRAVTKAVTKPILGHLPDTLQVTVSDGTATLASLTKRGWTRSHNEGETVGHGAKEPERETIAVHREDLEKLGEILKKHALLAFEGAA